MTDLASSPSARRLASMLGRSHCVWMASPSVALLSALVAGRARPKRLLTDEAAPPFVSNIARVAGASFLSVDPADIDNLLEKTLQADGLSPDNVWAVAIHADGRLATGDWLWRSASHGIPTIELCIGSLFPLVRQGVSAATFTIVDLDAEEGFKGVGLSGLLMDDPDLATRLKQFCLPGPETNNYVLNASPRGLEADEDSLVRRLDDAASLLASGASSMASFDGRTQRWRAATGDPGLESRWAARLSEAEGLHAVALGAATEAAAQLRAQLHAEQSLTQQWQNRFEAAERELAERTALVPDPATARAGQEELTRARLDKEKAESALAAMKAELDALHRKLTRAERERDLALLDAGGRDEAERSDLAQSRRRVAQLESEAAAAAEREARRNAEAEAAVAEMSSRISRLEADAVVVARSRERTLAQKKEADEELAMLRAESEALVLRLRAVEVDLDQARAEALQREEALRAQLGEQTQRGDEFEKEVGELTSFATKASRDWKLTQADLTTRIGQFQADLERAEQERTEQGHEKARLEQSLRLLETEGAGLTERLLAVEKDRDLAWAEAEKSEAAHRASLQELQHRVDEAEKALAEHKEQSVRLAEAWSQARTDLVDRLTRAETAAGELVRKNVDLGRSLAAAEKERETLASNLTRLEEDREAVVIRATGEQKALQASLEEQRQLAHLLEQEAAALKEREEALTSEWSVGQLRLTEQISRLEIVGVEAAEARTALQGEKARLEEALARLGAERDSLAEKLLEADQRETKQAAALQEQTERAARLEKEAHTQTVAAAEAAVAAARELVAVEKDRDQRLAEARSREEAQRLLVAESEKRVEQLESDSAAQTEREAEQLREWSLARTEFLDQIARLEAARVRLENANTDLATQKETAETELLTHLDGKNTFAAQLREVEKSRDIAVAAAEEKERAHASLLEKQRQRGEELEAELAARKAGEAEQAEEWSRSRADWLEKVAGLEATAVAHENAQTDLQNEKRRLEEAIESLRSERDAQAVRLSNAEKGRDEALAHAEGRVQAQTAALDEERARARALEEELTIQKTRVAEQADEWSASRAEFLERMARLETAAAATENATSDLVAAKAELEGTLAALRSEREGLATALVAVEAERDAARAEARRLEEDPGPEWRQERERAAGLASEVKALRERENALTEEWSTTRTGLSERIADLEQSLATAERFKEEALRGKEAAEEAREAAQREATLTQTQRVAELEKELAAWNERELAQIREWAELRAELSERIERLEADEAIADKARTELLNRKRESEQAFARVEREKAAISRRFEAVEKARDRAQAMVRTYETAHQELIARSASAQEWKARFLRSDPEHEEEGARHTGPLSKLISGWSEISDNTKRRASRIVEDPSHSSLGTLIDRPLSIEEAAGDGADPGSEVPGSLSPEKTDSGKGRKPDRKTPLPEAASGDEEAAKEETEPRGWLRGLAKKIRGPRAE